MGIQLLDKILLFPTALPDEIYTAYLSRIARCNGFAGRQIEDFLRLVLSQNPQPIAPYLERILTTLAKSAEKSVTNFVREHTFLPYRRGIVNNALELPHGETTPRFAATAYLNIAKNGTESRLCTTCIESDIAEHGMAYWRRLHQLPGVYVCATHNSALRYVNIWRPFFYSPAALVSRSLCYESRLLKAVANIEVKKFVTLSAALLGSARSTPQKFVWKTLRPIADEYGYNTYKNIDLRHRLSDEIIRTFPSLWLKTVIPQTYSTGKKELLHLLDSTLQRQTRKIPAEAFLLAASLLPGAEEKLIELIAAVGDRRQLFPNPFYWPSSTLRKQTRTPNGARWIRDRLRLRYPQILPKQ